MKKVMVILAMMGWGLLTNPARSSAQATELAQLALNIEKLNQFRQILQQMYDAYKIISEGYGKVKDLTSGNYKLHEVFLDGLFQVSPGIRKYQRVPDIISYQATIIKEYKESLNGFRNAQVFSEGQLQYFENVYKRVFDDSLKSLEELVMIITSGQLRMTDDERLAAIDRIHDNMKRKMVFVRGFNDEHTMLAIQHLQEKKSEQSVRGLYDLK